MLCPAGDANTGTGPASRTSVTALTATRNDPERVTYDMVAICTLLARRAWNDEDCADSDAETMSARWAGVALSGRAPCGALFPRAGPDVRMAGATDGRRRDRERGGFPSSATSRDAARS